MKTFSTLIILVSLGILGGCDKLDTATGVPHLIASWTGSPPGSFMISGTVTFSGLSNDSFVSMQLTGATSQTSKLNNLGSVFTTSGTRSFTYEFDSVPGGTWTLCAFVTPVSGSTTGFAGCYNGSSSFPIQQVANATPIHLSADQGNIDFGLGSGTLSAE